MAKISCEFDSETKKMKVFVDGVEQMDVCTFSCYSEMGEGEEDCCYGGCSLSFCSEEVNGVRYHKSAYASENKEKLRLYVIDSLNENAKNFHKAK
jgi:hypothetical protein